MSLSLVAGLLLGYTAIVLNSPSNASAQKIERASLGIDPREPAAVPTIQPLETLSRVAVPSATAN
jgi:hypothetical protein